MARAKEFDREKVLERAMHVFWARGYEATSLPELLDAMQIGRQSMYDTFGDKRALFIAALDRYIDRSEAAFHGRGAGAVREARDPRDLRRDRE